MFLTVAALLQRLPEEFDIDSIRIRYPVTYLNSLNVVLLAETRELNRILHVVRSSLQVQSLLFELQSLIYSVGIAISNGWNTNNDGRS